MERTKYTPKRLLSLLLALIMLLGMLPTAVFAADPVKQYSTTSFMNDGGARMDVELSCNNPLEVSTLPCNVTVDVHLTITVTGNDVKMVTLDTQDAGNLIKIGGKNATKESLGGSYWNGVEEMVPAQAADGTTPAAFAVNTKIIDATISGATGTLNKDRTISVPIKTTLGVTNTASIDVNKAIDQNVIFENVKLSKSVVTYTGDFKDQASKVVPKVNLVENDSPFSLPAFTASNDGHLFAGWLNNATNAVQNGEVTVDQDTTFEAVWEAAQPERVSVTFVESDVNATEKAVYSTETVYKNEKVPNPGEPNAPKDKVFSGWYYAVNDTENAGKKKLGRKFDFDSRIVENLEVYAKWEDAPTKYTVKWDGVYTGVSNLPAVQEVAANTVIQKAPDEVPLREGYTFAGWATSENGNAVDFPQKITAHTTFYAKWAKNTVNITWPTTPIAGVNTAAWGKNSVPKDATVNFTIKLEAGYQFNQGDVTLDGKPLGWTFNSATNTYCFTFKADAVPEDDTKNAEMKVEVTAPTIKKQVITLPSGTGYYATFIKCSTGALAANGKSSYEFSYGDTFEIKLHVTGVKKTVTLVVDGQEHIVGNQRGTFECAKENHVEHKVTDQPINISVRVEEQYTWRVDYVLLPNVGNYAPQYVSDGGVAIKPVAPKIDGYTFGGWYKDAAFQTEWDFANDTVTNDTIIYGKLNKNHYSITYKSNEPTDASGNKLNVATGTMPQDATVTTATDGTQTGGKEHGKPYPLSDAKPTLTGYDFKGWATSETGPVAYQPGEQYLIDADLTLYAVWAKKTYTVTVSSGAGYSTVPAGINTVAHGDTFKLTIIVERQYAATRPTVTDATGKAAAVDVSAQLSGTTSAFHAAKYTYEITNVTDDHVIEINVTQNKVRQVSYVVALGDANGASAVPENDAFLIQSVEDGYYASMPATPERSGYKFDHWERYHLVNGQLVKDETDDNNQPLADNAVFTKAITEDGVQFRAVYKKIIPTITIVNKNNICKLDIDNSGSHYHGGGFGLEHWMHDDSSNPEKVKENKASIDTNGEFKIAYGDSVAFDLVIDKGYDYSQLSVTANGLSMGLGDSITLNADGSTTIHYVLNHVTGNTRISVANIQRKTITINYFANAGDDVAQVPGPQTVNYYIQPGTGEDDTAKKNGYISKIEPKRNGYTFLGWCEVPAGTLEFDETTGKTLEYVELKDGTKYKVYQPNDVANFTKDTNLYAIWEAAELKVKLVITDEFVTSGNSTSISEDKILEYAYEGDKIYLVGELSENAQGTMTFYKRHRGDDDNKWSYIGSVVVNGGKYGVLETAAEPYEWGMAGATSANNHFWEYKVEFVPTNEEGYTSCKGADDLRVYSTAISWKLNGQDPKDAAWTLATDANKLTVYEGSIADANKVDSGVMVAKKTYWLQIPQVFEMDGGMTLKQVNEGKTGRYVLIPGTDYTVQWEYQDEKGAWQEYGSRENSDSVKVTPEFSGYVFRAKVYPADASIYTKAAKYNNIEVVKDQYEDWLETLPTVKTEREDTAITLAVDGAVDESNSVKINGATPFVTDLNLAENGTHKAQYEGQKITLAATVTNKNTGAALTMGTVEFFRKNGTAWESIGTAAVQPDGTNVGVAAIEVEMSAFSGTATSAKDEFYAKYVQNETYQESATYTPADAASGTNESGKTTVVYIKSAELKTPVIMDADKPTAHKGYWLNGETKVTGEDANKTETTYNYHLGGLMAGIPHTFELKKTGATPATGDWSVVARDGRAVPEDMYTMKWWTLTDGKNWNETTTDDPAFSVGDTKFGERYRIRLTGKDVFDGSVQDSKDIVIGELQGVVVTVEAIDAIKKTDATDVYQLNDITLTAKVEAAEQNAESKPEGTVAFYYEDKDAAGKTIYKYLDKAKLVTNTSGDKVATIKTNELPVTPTTNIKRDVKITAVYFGDQTFKASENWVKTSAEGATPEKWDITKAAEDKAEADKTVKPDTVTVYSSVVYNCEDENKKQDGGNEKGIHISLATGVLKPNNEATLKLSDIYTLDCTAGLSEDMLKLIAKLDPNSDYEIQWQKLTGATAYTDGGGVKIGESDRWTNIDGEKNGTITLIVEQNTAYRAMITVKDQPITKGSFTEVDQDVDGRKVYYSNILMPTDASISMSVAINTSETDKDNSEGITEGETVTANVFLSGAVGSVPNAEIEVMVEADKSKGNSTGYKKTFTKKQTVNGWNAIEWDTKAEDVKPGFYTMRITAKTNTGYAPQEITRSLIVRESSYDFTIDNTTTTYNGQTQGVTVTLNGFDFKGTAINDAAAKSWTVKYYKDAKLEGGKRVGGTQVEPSQAGTYVAEVTLPGSAYWTEHSETVDFTISKRSVSIADAVAQAKVYDNSTDVNIVEVILNDAVTDQGNTGLPTNNNGIINGDSVYAVVAEKGATLNSKDAGNNSFTITKLEELRGDDAKNYKWDEATYTENIYVSRSQVYGETAALIPGTDVSLKLKKGADFPADEVIKMIDQSGRKIDFTVDPSKDTESYTLTFYYHSDTEIKQTNDLSKLGLYTVVARPNQSNYKSGVTMKFEVIDGETTYAPAAEPKPSTLITISNTAELYGKANGVDVTLSNKDATVRSIEYLGTVAGTEAKDLNAGRYIVKVTASTGDVAYGIYTITKAHPTIGVTPATDLTYNSTPQNGYTALTGTSGTAGVDYYLTYAGDVAIGFDKAEDGNVAEQAPVDAGDYVVTLHVNETQNYTAHEVSAPFTINKKALTIQADSWTTTQYDAFPTMTATYDGLAAEQNDGTPDTSLRDVQIAPEFIYNPTADGKPNYSKPNYSNPTLDEVGRIVIKPIDALSKNYAITYVNGEYTKTETTSNPDLTILGLPQSGEKDGTGKKYVAKVYYGDEIQLYPYGNYTKWANGSSELTWSIENAQVTDGHGSFSIGEKTGILKVDAIGTFTVKLTRGDVDGEQAISTTVTVTAIRKEAKIALKEVDKVYDGKDQTYDFANITVHDDLYREITPFTAGKLDRTKLSRKDIGTQIPTATVNTTTTGSWFYQSETYGGQFTINDKEATVAPGAQSTVYGTLETFDENPKWTVTGEANSVKAVDNVNVASQTDAYNRLDVYDGYEILVAGTEDINYNVKYKTDHNTNDAEDSKVTEYKDVVFTSKTVNDLNDATVYGETPNALDWTLTKAQSTTRGTAPDTKDYTDNLADFNLPEIFVYQVYDNCTGNAKTYKAANRTTTVNPLAYNVDVLKGTRHSKPDTTFDTLLTIAHNEGNGEHPNYTLFFNVHDVSDGVENYTMTNAKTGNEKSITTALGSLGYFGGNDTLVKDENFVEGSANIAQRPVKVEKDTNLGTVTLYWKLPQKDLYTALLNILKAEPTSNGRGLAKGHTIKDLDIQFTIGTETVSKTSTDPMNFQNAGTKTVTLTIGDTNYVLEGKNTFNVDFETMRIRAYYYNKTFTGFNVRIQKIGANDEPAGPLTSTKGLTFKVLKETNGVLNTETDYATNKMLTFNNADGTYGYFTGTYDQLPLLGAGELYVFQLYEYGVPLERK